jgi:hypothetical protein
MGAWPDVQVDIQNKLDDLKSNVDPASPDYETKASQIVTDGLTQFRATLEVEPEVLERFAPSIATFAASTRQGERRYALQARAKTQGAAIEKWRDAQGNSLLIDPTPDKLQALLGESDRMIEALDLPAQVKETYRTQAKAGLARTFLDGRLLAGDWQGAQGVLRQGLLDAYLDPNDKKNYLRQAENAASVAAAEQRAAEARQLSDARDSAKAVEAKVKAGIDPTPAELRAARSGLAAAGADEAELIEFDALDVKVAVNRRYSGAPLSTLRKDRDFLLQRKQAGEASETEQMQLAQLDNLVDAAEEREADGLREAAGQGVPGQLSVLQAVSGRAPAERYAVAEKVKEGLGFLSGLNAATQKAALTGREVRDARPQDFGKRKDVKLAFDTAVGPVAAQMGGDYDNALNAAWDIMTVTMARQGRSGFDQGLFNNAVMQVTGGTRRPDGVVQGGIQKYRGKPVWLPDWMTPTEFDQALARDLMGDARYASGQPVDKADVLANYRVTWAGDQPDGAALYRLQGPDGGWLMDRNDRPYTIRLRRRGR